MPDINNSKTCNFKRFMEFNVACYININIIIAQFINEASACTGANGASSMLVATNSRLPPKMTTLMIIGYQKLKPDVRI